MGDDNDKDFYREILKAQIELQKDGNKAMADQNKMLCRQNSILEEIKLSLQTKPCLIKAKTEELQEGWKDSTITTYKWIIGSLFTLIIGILTSIGLYNLHIK